MTLIFCYLTFAMIFDAQINSVKNNRNRLLDLMFVGDAAHATVSRVNAISLPEDPFHPTLSIFVELLSQSYKLSLLTTGR